MRSSMMLVALVMIMKGMQGAMEGTMRLRSLTGNTILMRCVIKSTQELRMLSMSHVTLMSHVTCPMSSHVILTIINKIAGDSILKLQLTL